MPRPFFFLCAERIQHGPDATDLFIDLDKGPLQLPITAKCLNLSFDLALVGSRGEAFGNRFAIYLIGQPRMWTVARITGNVAMASRIPAAPPRASNRPGAKIFQFRKLPQDGGPLLFEIGE